MALGATKHLWIVLREINLEVGWCGLGLGGERGGGVRTAWRTCPGQCTAHITQAHTVPCPPRLRPSLQTPSDPLKCSGYLAAVPSGPRGARALPPGNTAATLDPRRGRASEERAARAASGTRPAREPPAQNEQQHAV